MKEHEILLESDEVLLDRLALMLKPHIRASMAKNGLPDLGVVAESMGVVRASLSPSNLKKLSSTTRRRLASTLIALQCLEKGPAVRFLTGRSNDAGEIGVRAASRACTAEGCTYFGPDVDPNTCRCSLHKRTEPIQQWIAQVEALLPKAPPHLRDAWERAKGGALTGANMARIAQMPLQTWKAEWQAAGLPARPIQGRPRRMKPTNL